VTAFCFWASKGSTLLMRQRRPLVVVAEILPLVLPPHLYLLLVLAPPVAGSQASLASMGSADFGRQQRALLASTHLRPSSKYCRRVTYCANWTSTVKTSTPPPLCSVRHECASCSLPVCVACVLCPGRPALTLRYRPCLRRLASSPPYCHSHHTKIVMYLFQ